jgi:hypothetical protein
MDLQLKPMKYKKNNRIELASWEPINSHNVKNILYDKMEQNRIV